MTTPEPARLFMSYFPPSSDWFLEVSRDAQIRANGSGLVDTHMRWWLYKLVHCSHFFHSVSMNFKQDEEPMQTDVGNGFVLYTGGAKGTDQLAEELGLHFDVQVRVLIPPGHSRSRTITPVSPQLLALANPYIEEAAEKLDKRVPTDFYILHLIQRNYEIVRRADIVYAFGILEDDGRRVKGGTGWTVQLALDQGKRVFLFDIACQAWFRSVYHYNVVEGSLEVSTHFVSLSDKPTLHQNSAVVGSRILDENARQEIRGLFHRTFALPDNLVSNIEQTRLEGKELDL